MTNLLSSARREFLARAIMDVVKLLAAGALATSFFANYPWLIRALLVSLVLVMFLSAWILFPERGGR